MILNLGSGGGNLNFSVVGSTTQPSPSSNNTFWVNTDTEITNYAFSQTEPEGAEEGMVWILTGSNGYLRLNMLKENAVYIYPLFCKQYISGAWVEKAVQVYTNGAWSALWTGQLFDNGNQYETYTGGWVTEREPNDGYHQNQVTIGNYFNFEMVSYGEEQSDSDAHVYTANTIDITDYSTLCIEVVSSGYTGAQEYGYLEFGVGTTQGIFATSKALSYSKVGSDSDLGLTEGVHRLDITALTGNCYIGLSGDLIITSVSKVWLEP